MSQQNLRTAGGALLIVSVILFFVGWQQYQANADNVQAVNQMMQVSPFGASSRMGASSPFGSVRVTPATPASTTYAVFFGILTVLGGIACLVKGKPGQASADASR